ncbi:MAG: TonB-dependent receptor [Rubrivivax sp.]
MPRRGLASPVGGARLRVAHARRAGYRFDGGGGFNTTLQPQRSEQFELSAKWRSGGVQIDVAAFDVRVDDEIGVATSAGGRSAFQNVGRTAQRGLEVAARWQPLPAWRRRSPRRVGREVQGRLPRLRRRAVQRAHRARAGRQPHCRHAARHRLRRAGLAQRRLRRVRRRSAPRARAHG